MVQGGGGGGVLFNGMFFLFLAWMAKMEKKPKAEGNGFGQFCRGLHCLSDN